jgi:signal peptidase I
MAPTLRGAHMQFKSPQTGYEWALTTSLLQTDPSGQNPNPIQKGIVTFDPMTVHEPGSTSGLEIGPVDVPRSWGDRIFVMKYLYSMYDPSRFDVVVFKNPRDPTVNYIKRLLGLPGQMVALIDGDVFWREIKPGEVDSAGRPTMADPWALADWRVARKPERAQLAMWQPVFSSEYTPLHPSKDGRRWFTSPWRPAEPGAHQWQIEDRRDYVYSGQGDAVLAWDDQAHPITDRYAYNALDVLDRAARPVPAFSIASFPVSDLRLSFGIRPSKTGQAASAVVIARGHEFRGQIEGSGAITLEMRPVDATGHAAGAWTVVGTGALPGGLPADRVTDIDFWHVDQSLKMFVDGKLAAQGVYDWTPEERLVNSVGLTLDQVMSSDQSLTDSKRYIVPKARFEFSGGAFTLYRVALARDIHYQAAIYPQDNDDHPHNVHSMRNQPAKGTHPKNTIILNKDQFFVCGDNSPMSLDARLWDVPNPWVAEIDPTMGVVNRDLLIGKAFFVYFPAPFHNNQIPVPDFGSMRFIW